MSGVPLGAVPLGGATTGAALGAVAGVGLWLVLWRLAARRPRLDDRLAPYLRARDHASALLRPVPVHSPFPTVERLLAPVMQDAVRLVGRLGSPAGDVQRRLQRAGSGLSVEEFRAEQVVWTVLGTAAGLAAALTLVVGRGTPAPAGAVLVMTSALAGFLGRDGVLSSQVSRRERRLLAELPTVAELLALSVSAGEGALGALERVARSTHGELSREITAVVTDTRVGVPLTTALEGMADRTGLLPLARLAEAVAVAAERGTPLAEVLRSQAQDVRDAGRRALMEAGGRKEVSMMIPVVFLILPVTVVFAVFPGILALRLGM